MKKANQQNTNQEKLTFVNLVIIFLIACLTGYGVEELWCFIKNGYFESRQSLIYGPLSVLYGIGAVLLTLSLYKIKNSKWYVVYGVSFVVCTIAEYIASLGQEICFGSVAWDYSNLPLNINGRVCLLYSLFWGALGLVWIKVVYPALNKFISKLPVKFNRVLAAAFTIFFVFDCVISASAAFRMDQRAKGIPPENSIEVFLDNHYDDERMHNIYANSKDV